MSAIVEHPRGHIATEQYLVAIYLLEADRTEAIQARLAERLGHAAPTVSEMVHRLEEDGYITVNRRVLTLTTAGRELAENVLRKHCLAARLLADVLGLPWHLVHAEADRWEHIISDDVAARLVAVLGDPTTCPHGCPIPGLCAEVKPTSCLADAKVGQRVRLIRLIDPGEFDVEELAYLEENRFLPGCEATVTAKGPDGSLVLGVGAATVVIGAATARRIRVVLSA
ncbi:MAG TPA: metal-dependent transcriptional regulator [Acidimicrobiales bacterium]|nr:metal-dependent transcriptional regulator [Acidimicrobiales bacterium]